MSQLLLFALLGLGLGSLIAGIGLAIVVAFRGSGVVNLATGAIAMLGAYVFYDLRTAGKLLLPPIPFAPHRLSLGGPWPTLPAILAALAGCADHRSPVRHRRAEEAARRLPLAKLLASLGLLVTLQAIAVLRFGTSGQSRRPSSRPARRRVDVVGQWCQQALCSTGIWCSPPPSCCGPVPIHPLRARPPAPPRGRAKAMPPAGAERAVAREHRVRTLLAGVAGRARGADAAPARPRPRSARGRAGAENACWRGSRRSGSWPPAATVPAA